MDDTTSPLPTAVDVAVVGAGIAGLAAALTLARDDRRVLVLDAHAAGGRARTDEHHGVLHNVGPHAVYRGGALAQLLHDHGIAITGGVPGRGVTKVIRDGTAVELALRPADLLRTPLLGRGDRLRLLATFGRLQRARPAKLVGVSLADWLGDTPVAVRQFVEMLARVSTYADAPDLLDAGAAIAQMQSAIADGVLYVDGGWGSIVRSMLDVLARRGVDVRTGCEVLAVEADGVDAMVRTADGDVRCDAVVIGAGGPDTATRLTGALVAGADRITAPVTSSVLDLTTRHATGRRDDALAAFGLDEPLYLSTHAPLARLAPDGQGLVSLQHYLRPGTDPDTPAAERARLRAFARLAGIGDERVTHDRYLHRVVVSHGAPTAAGGGLAGRPRVHALGLGNVLLAGDWVGDIGWIADASAASGVAAARAAVSRRASIVR